MKRRLAFVPTSMLAMHKSFMTPYVSLEFWVELVLSPEVLGKGAMDVPEVYSQEADPRASCHCYFSCFGKAVIIQMICTRYTLMINDVYIYI